MVTKKTPARKKTKAKRMPAVAGEARYLAVFNQLCQDITDGVYQVGELLPTEPEVCDLFGVSRFTARDALTRLNDGSWLIRPPRAAMVVASTDVRTPSSQLSAR